MAKTKKLTPLQYPAIQLKKRHWGFSMVTFFVEAGDIKRWCGVYRKSISQKGYQRILKPEHFQQITKFLESDNNVIPNSVVIAFNDKLKIGSKTNEGGKHVSTASFHPIDPDSKVVDDETVISQGTLQVLMHPKCVNADLNLSDAELENELSNFRSAYVIDGQHRIAGGNAASGNIYYPVTAFLGIDKEEQAFHFIVINRKAKKVSKHDIDAVIPKEIYSNLQKRLIDASIYNSDADIVFGLDNLPESPFCGKIRWANNDNTKAPISKGAVDRVIKLTRTLPEDIHEKFSDEAELIIAIWSGICKHLKPLLEDRDYKFRNGETYENQFLRKIVGVAPALQLTVNKALEYNVIKNGAPNTLANNVYKYIKDLPLEFFYCKWLQSSITNDARISELSDLMRDSIRTQKVPYTDQKGRNWFAAPVSLEAAKAAKEEERKQKQAKKQAAREEQKKKNGAKKKAANKKAANKKAANKKTTKKSKAKPKKS